MAFKEISGFMRAYAGCVCKPSLLRVFCGLSASALYTSGAPCEFRTVRVIVTSVFAVFGGSLWKKENGLKLGCGGTHF